MEVEAKFSIPDEKTFQRLLKTTTLAGFSLGEALLVEIHDRYLDTADNAILAAGFACRLRQEGDRTLITLKGLGGAAGAVHRRIEEEVDLSGPLPPVEWPSSPAREMVLNLSGNQPLVPLFDLSQSRHSRIAYDGGRAVAELSLDRAHIIPGDSDEMGAAFLELEAELQPNGREPDLDKLVTELETVWGLVPEQSSKFERGLALSSPGMRSADGGEGREGIELTAHERAILEDLSHQREVIARRARLVLAWDDGLSRAEMVEQSGLSARRARYWLHAFRQRRLGIFPDRVLRATAGEEEGAPAAQRVVEIGSGEEPLPPGKTVKLLKKPGIEPDDPMSEAGRKTFRFHYRRMVFHEPGTRLGEDIEALHDMRVATRRMRAAFRVFGDYFDPEVTAPFLKGLRRTGRALGAVRDLDVFRDKIQTYRRSLPESQQGSLDEFLAVVETKRAVAREQMVVYLDGAKYHKFKERFGEFVETKGMGSLPIAPPEPEPQPYRVRHVAPVAIYERFSAVRAYDEWVGIPNPPTMQLHALRIACKRLRYTLEFFEEVLGPDTKALIKEVVAMQDHLGDLQDAVVASGILRDFLVWGTWGHAGDLPAPRLEAPVIAPGVATYLAAKQIELQNLLDTFPQAWQRLTGPEISQMVAEAVVVL